VRCACYRSVFEDGRSLSTTELVSPDTAGFAGIGSLMRREAYVLAYIDAFWIIVWMKSLTASPSNSLSDWRGMEENMRKIDITNPDRVGVATAKRTILLLVSRVCPRSGLVCPLGQDKSKPSLSSH
jgi:hypothetical protein